MKSDHAIPPAGIVRSSIPPAPPIRPLASSFPAPPRSVLPKRGWRYLPPPPVSARQNRWIKAFSFLGDTNLLLLATVGAVLLGMFLSYMGGLERVTLRINDQETTLWTRQQTVRSALAEAGISWNPEDIIRPALDQPLPANGQIQIRPATQLVLNADGNTIESRSQATTIHQVLDENGIEIKPQDQVFLDGRLVQEDALLPRYTASAGQAAALGTGGGPLHITVTRALPLTVNDNGTVTTLYTTENTLGTALTRAGVELYVGDSVSPDLTTPVTTGASVFIRRSRPATITVDGKTIRTRTRADTVGDLLSQEGITLEGKDYAVPAPGSPIVDNLRVDVTRVREEYTTQTEELPFQNKTYADSNLELDQRVVAQTGAKGIKKREFKSVYENGKLLSTELEREWIAQPPQDHIINYGTRVVVRDLTLADGSVVQYWRKVRLLATAYTAATSGKSKDHPEYGRTRLGLRAGYGVVAVDPRVINLSSEVYVPGYGLAVAGDTGGRIKGRRIDLGYPEGQVEDWYRWVDVYLLTPVPSTSQINTILPDYPVERNAR